MLNLIVTGGENRGVGDGTDIFEVLGEHMSGLLPISDGLFHAGFVLASS